ncbi:MAG: AAA family ATPase [Deltaproteobacteria bacterium]|nr:AAA family ATPase [Deltaproteobacteria bacterium]
MKLQELRIANFRQFHGEQEIVFAQEDQKNITVIHGYNGAGKTALLNAFVWCLYGEVTKDLEAPDRLLNEAASSELRPGGETTVSVRLRFLARGQTYTANRQVTYRKEADGSVAARGEPTLTLFRVADSGAQEQVNNAQNAIDQLLPKRLYPFFFFNGERVEAIASAGAYEDVEQGVKTLLDVEIYERSVRHLRDQVIPELSRELRQFGSQEAQALVDEQTRELERERGFRDALIANRQNLTEIAKELEAIEQAQRRVEAIRDLVAKRNAVTTQKKAVTERLDAVRIQRAKLLSRSGYLAFAGAIFEQVDEKVRDARQKGELPAKVKPQFVDDLLQERTCICGRNIGPAEAERLTAWRANTGLADLEEQIAMTSAVLPGLRARRTEYYGGLDELQDALAGALAERRRLDEELDELGTKIGDGGHGEEAANLERRRNEERGREQNVKIEIALTTDKLTAVEDRLREIQQKLNHIELQNEKARLIQRQIQAVNQIADALERIYFLQKDDVRRELSQRIHEIWSNAAIKEYRATVTEEFRLDLKKNVGGIEQPVFGASTGEKQVLALSFVGSLVWKARKNEERNVGEAAGVGRDLVVGGEYPLVMDSPFGALEDDYRRKVAEWIPTLASQVIVMASKTQWRNEVESAMRDRIGREYILELHTPKAQAERTIELRGRELPYVRETSGAEQTLIREVQ